MTTGEWEDSRPFTFRDAVWLVLGVGLGMILFAGCGVPGDVQDSIGGLATGSHACPRDTEYLPCPDATYSTCWQGDEVVEGCFVETGDAPPYVSVCAEACE